MKDIPIIILHGWGATSDNFQAVEEMLQNSGRKVFLFDLPGFGKEPIVHDSMNLDDYVTFVHSFVEKKKFSTIILIGHSFGGRIALKYTWRYPKEVSKLILAAAPIIRHKPLNKQIAYLLAVIGGKIFEKLPTQIRETLRKCLYFLIGEWDYYNAGPLKQVFKNIINESLTSYAREVQNPTLLIWGSEDRLVPIADVEKIKKMMPQAKSVIIENYGHKLPYENPEAFCDAVLKFI